MPYIKLQCHDKMYISKNNIKHRFKHIGIPNKNLENLGRNEKF